MHGINAAFRISCMELTDEYCCHLLRTSGDKTLDLRLGRPSSSAVSFPTGKK
jgi:hypothetical protein